MALFLVGMRAGIALLSSGLALAVWMIHIGVQVPGKQAWQASRDSPLPWGKNGGGSLLVPGTSLLYSCIALWMGALSGKQKSGEDVILASSLLWLLLVACIVARKAINGRAW